MIEVMPTESGLKAHTFYTRVTVMGLLVVFGLSQHYQQIFELTRLNEAIPVCEAEAEALALASAL